MADKREEIYLSISHNLKDVDKWSSLSLYLQVRGRSVTCELGLYLYSRIG